MEIYKTIWIFRKKKLDNVTDDTIYNINLRQKMPKAHKFYRKWADTIPREARVNEVKTLLDHYFPGMWNQKRTSHIVVRCERLKAFQEYQPFGEISIPVKGGQKVKGFYIKALIRAIDLLSELGDET